MREFHSTASDPVTLMSTDSGRFDQWRTQQRGGQGAGKVQGGRAQGTRVPGNF